MKVYPVVRGVDGGTIVVKIDGKVEKVRHIGVDTPETVDPRKPVQDLGKEASAFTRKLLTGKSIALEYDQQKRDRYKRILAYVYVGEGKARLCVNREIIAKGYGHAYTKYPFNRAKMDDFRKAEREARENKRGLWADRKAEVKEKPKPNAAQTVYVTRTGRKYHSEGCRFLAKSKSEMTLEQAKKSGYTPCSVCRPPR